MTTTSPAAAPMRAAGTDPRDARALADQLIRYLETGVARPGLFAPDLFCDLTLPTWRLQAAGARDSLKLRSDGHPWPGRVRRSRFDPTPTGFVLEVEEEWRLAGEDWYCRELVRADISANGISELTVYCTGDWNSARIAEHAAEVTLLRP